MAHWLHTEGAGENRSVVPRGGSRVPFYVLVLHYYWSPYLFVHFTIVVIAVVIVVRNCDWSKERTDGWGHVQMLGGINMVLL